jgi:2-oxo-4-hydroxy-4-carboxy-5-ureidoimidazoline decarboxylase
VNTLSLEMVNRLEPAEFTRTLGALFEHSPWVAERSYGSRPFASVDALHGAMMAAVRAAPRAEQLALLRAHPDLAGKAARAGAMSASSVGEQSAAGLDRLTAEEYDRFDRLNRAYREKFGFPFIIAVRRHDTHSILNAFERRLGHSIDEEVDAALTEVGDITRMRLDRLVSGSARGARTLTTHVLDITRGCPAAGVRVDLSTLDPDGRLRLIRTMRTTADGRTDAPLLEGDEMGVGRYEIAFHVGDYFREVKVALADPPYLDVVPVRFAVADPQAHYHVPLLVSPWSYATYRGS